MLGRRALQARVAGPRSLGAPLTCYSRTGAASAGCRWSSERRFWGGGQKPVRSHSVKQVEKWKWRIRWSDRWTTSAIHQTEAEVRREHPEATRIDGSRIVVELPDTPEELAPARR